MNQKKKVLWSLSLMTGMLLQFIGICFGAESAWRLSGLCSTSGAVLFSLSINRLYRLFYEKKFPDSAHREQIEMRDERNVQIRNCAKSKTSNISRWIIIGLAWVNFFLMNGPLWMTLSLVGVFILVYILEWHYTEQYQRTM